MVDIDPSKLPDIAKEIHALKDEFINMEKALVGVFGKMVEGSAKGIEAFKKMKDGVDISSGGIGKMNNLFDAMRGGVGNVNDEAKDLFVTFGGFAGITSHVLKLPVAFNDTANSIKNMSAGFSSTLGYLNQIKEIPFAGKLGIDKVVDGLKNFGGPGAEAIDNVRGMEVAFLRSATAGGNLSNAINGVGESFEFIDAKMAQYGNMAAEVGNANNLTAGQTIEFMKALNRIPGALEQNVGRMNMMDAVLKVSVGTFRDSGEVIGMLEGYYKTLGVSGEDALQIITRTTAAATAMRMPVELMDSFVKDTASTFKLFGNNTQRAIDIMSRFGPELQKSGLGPEAIQSVVRGITEGIGQMNIAQKSFLSAQTGGKGGLAGGYQIDLLLKQGKIDEVYAKIEQSLKGIAGGRIVKLEDAAKDQGAAAQFTKQIQLLTSGPFKIADNAQSAQRILEVLSKGGKIGQAVPGLGIAKETLAEATDRGKALQERQFNPLVKFGNTLESGAVQMASQMSDSMSSASQSFANKIMMESEGSARVAGRGVVSEKPLTLKEQNVALFNKTSAAINPSSEELGLGDRISSAFKNIFSKERLPILESAPSPIESVRQALPEKRTSEVAVPGIAARQTAPATLVIKVMGEKDVIELINVQYDEKIKQFNIDKTTKNAVGYSKGGS